MVKLRLYQFLLKTGAFRSKEDIIEAINSEKIRINNKPIKNPNFRIDPKRKNVYYNGKIIRPKRRVYFILNKPKGMSCQKNENNSVYDLIEKIDLDEEIKNSLFVVGRLDINTSGLIVITNDGSLATRILDPDKKIKKAYLVNIDKNINESDIDKLRNGVTIDLDNKKYKTKPTKIKLIKDKELIITISEGKKRQIRKMFNSLSYEVIELKRISIGNLELEQLKESEIKEVTKEEIYEKIFK